MAYSSQCVFSVNDEGFIKRTWFSNRPIWLSDISTEKIFTRASQASEAKLLSAFAFRILSADKTIGILEFFSRATQKPDSALNETVLSIGVQIGQFIQHKQIEDAQKRSEAQQKQAQLCSFFYIYFPVSLPHALNPSRFCRENKFILGSGLTLRTIS